MAGNITFFIIVTFRMINTYDKAIRPALSAAVYCRI